MASIIGINLRAFLLADPAITAFVGTGSTAARISQNIVPQPLLRPFIHFMRSGSFRDVDTAGNGLLTDSSWDIECQATDINATEELVDAVKARLNGHFGAFGSTDICVKGIFVTDHDDDYIPKAIGEDDDEHVHVASLNVQILI